VTYRDVIRRLRRRATTAVLLRTVGSHERWLVDGHCAVTIPHHPGDIPPGTLASIGRQGAHCLGGRWLR
jgi:predicted RNA binding protein YcfA (HicA-like mRNA interferase family)